MYALTHIIFQRVFELTRGRVRLRASGSHVAQTVAQRRIGNLPLVSGTFRLSREPSACLPPTWLSASNLELMRACAAPPIHIQILSFIC